MTPNQIEVLIHCHGSSCKHPRIDAPAVQQAISYLERHDLVEKIGGEEYYHTTKKGCAHMEVLCSTPWPVQKWVNQLGEIIEI